MVNETQRRLLDSAEELFADRGFEAVSLRDITQHAGTNVASVNYHFASKDGLINAVVGRHAVPIQEARLKLLQVLLKRETSPSVQEVVEAFLRPLKERILERESCRRIFSRFLARMMTEEAHRLPEELLPQCQEAAEATVRAMMKAAPHLSEWQAYYRMKFCFSVMANAMEQDEMLIQLSGGRLDRESDWERIFTEVVNFCVGGVKG